MQLPRILVLEFRSTYLNVSFANGINMLEAVYFDNGTYVPSTLEDEIKRIQADAASIRELFGTFDGLHVSAITGPLSTNDMDGEHEEGEDNDVDSDVDDESYWSSVRDLFCPLNFLKSYLISCKGHITTAAQSRQPFRTTCVLSCDAYWFATRKH